MEDMVLATWSTLTELNNDYFEVQKSVDGFEFETFATVPGAGTRFIPKDYQTLDHDPLPGTSYYRLKQVDNDGTATLSAIVKVTMFNGFIKVYPNPVIDDWFIQFNGNYEFQSVKIELIDSQGRKLFDQTYNSPRKIKLNRNDIANGLYLLKIDGSNGESLVRKIYCK